jgi:phosphate transport system protein
MPATPRHHFEEQLKDLQQDVLRMGTYVVEMLTLAMEALTDQNVALANRVIDMDDEADRMDLEIEQTCMRLLALQQPMSRDLRIIGTALKIVTDLERIGDFSVDIAKTARRMAREPYFKPVVHIPQMAECVKALVRESLQAYVGHDLTRVNRAIEMDDQVDRYYDEIFTELLQHVERDPHLFRQATWFTHIVHFLERIADHAVNVAERVYYMETGSAAQLARDHAADVARLEGVAKQNGRHSPDEL